MREPVEIVYKNLGNKLGNPKEFKSNVEEESKSTDLEKTQIQFKIPNSVIKGNLNL